MPNGSIKLMIKYILCVCDGGVFVWSVCVCVCGIFACTTYVSSRLVPLLVTTLITRLRVIQKTERRTAQSV